MVKEHTIILMEVSILGDGRYVDGYGNEIIPPVSERPKGYKPPPWLKNENGKNVTEQIGINSPTGGQYYSKELKKVFTIPFLTMIGVWIIVYYQFTSHYHKGIGRTIQYSRGYVSGNVSVDNYRPLEVRVVR